MTPHCTQHRKLLTLLRFLIVSLFIQTIYANNINDGIEYETQDEWSAIERLREENEGMPRTCRRDLCDRYSHTLERKGTFDWKDTRVGETRRLRCPYAVHTPVYVENKCILVNGSAVTWEEGNHDACPDPPLAQLMQTMENEYDEFKSNGIDPSLNYRSDTLHRIKDALVDFNEFPTNGDDLEALIRFTLDVIPYFVASGMTISQTDAHDFLYIWNDLLLNKHEELVDIADESNVDSEVVLEQLRMLPQLIDNDPLLSTVEIVFEHFVLLKFRSDPGGYISISKNPFPSVQIAYGTGNEGLDVIGVVLVKDMDAFYSGRFQNGNKEDQSTTGLTGTYTSESISIEADDSTTASVELATEILSIPSDFDDEPNLMNLENHDNDSNGFDGFTANTQGYARQGNHVAPTTSSTTNTISTTIHGNSVSTVYSVPNTHATARNYPSVNTSKIVNNINDGQAYPPMVPQTPPIVHAESTSSYRTPPAWNLGDQRGNTGRESTSDTVYLGYGYIVLLSRMIDKERNDDISMIYDVACSDDDQSECPHLKYEGEIICAQLEEHEHQYQWISGTCITVKPGNKTQCICNGGGSFGSVFAKDRRHTIDGDHGESGKYPNPEVPDSGNQRDDISSFVTERLEEDDSKPGPGFPETIIDDGSESNRDDISSFVGFPYNAELAILGTVLNVISLSCLLATLLSYTLFRKARRGRTTIILLNLCVALIALSVALFIAEELVKSKAGCRIANIIRYYLVFVTLLWNSVEAVHMYLFLIKVFAADIHRFAFKAGAIAWGIPGAMAGIALAVDRDIFNGDYIIIKQESETSGECAFKCQLRDNILYYGYLLPMSIIIIYNLVVFSLVLRVIVRQGKQASGKNRSGMVKLIGAAATLVLLGVPWIFSAFGAIDVHEDSNLEPLEGVFQVIFIIFVNLQGLFIFIFHCLRNANIRESWSSVVSEVSKRTGLTTSHASSQHNGTSSKKDTSIKMEGNTN